MPVASFDQVLPALLCGQTMYMYTWRDAYSKGVLLAATAPST